MQPLRAWLTALLLPTLARGTRPPPPPPSPPPLPSTPEYVVGEMGQSCTDVCAGNNHDDPLTAPFEFCDEAKLATMHVEGGFTSHVCVDVAGCFAMAGHSGCFPSQVNSVGLGDSAVTSYAAPSFYVVGGGSCDVGSSVSAPCDATPSTPSARICPCSDRGSPPPLPPPPTPYPPNKAPQPPPPPEQGLSDGALVGLSVGVSAGALCLIVCIAAVAVWVWRGRDYDAVDA